MSLPDTQPKARTKEQRETFLKESREFLESAKREFEEWNNSERAKEIREETAFIKANPPSSFID